MVVQAFSDKPYIIPDLSLPPKHLTTVLSQIESAYPMVCILGGVLWCERTSDIGL